MMPRHEVERAWHRKHPGGEMVAPNKKTYAHLHYEFHRYRLEVFGTERSKGVEWTRDTRIRVIPAICKVCGNQFVGGRKADTCSRACGSRLRHVAPVVESLGQGGELRMATAAMHPELAAVETIYEALRQLPDQAARERVMTYAKQLVESADATRPALVHTLREAGD